MASEGERFFSTHMPRHIPVHELYVPRCFYGCKSVCPSIFLNCPTTREEGHNLFLLYKNLVDIVILKVEIIN